MASVLELMHAAATEAKLNRPTAVIGVTSYETEMLLSRALHKTARELQAFDWQNIVREKTFVTVAAAIQTDTPLPTDFLRFVPETIYNRTKRLRVQGPLTSDEWQSIQATSATWTYDSFRLRGNVWLISPTPAAGETIAYEYITKYIGTDTTGATPKTAFTVDTDLTYWDDELMILGIAKHLLDIDGADYAQKSMDFQTRLNVMLKADGGSRRINFNEGTGSAHPTPPIIPDLLVFT